ncbi:hypothetical protein E2C01_019319 [Portunus trituberculatus]|uniref:Uncharacterized protein n=1 Tax=Portunus trituberculatus TaxID=210409 RepID=A0A5B7DXX8_PORTR|nr:hypothetical protein [Portunus trituberculatus]
MEEVWGRSFCRTASCWGSGGEGREERGEEARRLQGGSEARGWKSASSEHEYLQETLLRMRKKEEAVRRCCRRHTY